MSIASCGKLSRPDRTRTHLRRSTTTVLQEYLHRTKYSCSVRNESLFAFVSPKASSCSSRYTASLCAVRFLPYTPWLRRMGASYVHCATTAVIRACDYAVEKVLILAAIIFIQFINFRQGAPPPFYTRRVTRDMQVSFPIHCPIWLATIIAYFSSRKYT